MVDSATQSRNQPIKTRFRAAWVDVEIPKLDDMCARMEAQLQERQNIELRQFEAALTAETYHPKHSPAALDMRQRMQFLGAQGRYPEAQEVKAKLEALSSRELSAAHASRLKRFAELSQIYFAGFCLPEKSCAKNVFCPPDSSRGRKRLWRSSGGSGRPSRTSFGCSATNGFGSGTIV